MTDNFSDAARISEGSFGAVFAGEIGRGPAAVEALAGPKFRQLRGFGVAVKRIHPELLTSVGGRQSAARMPPEDLASHRASS